MKIKKLFALTIGVLLFFSSSYAKNTNVAEQKKVEYLLTQVKNSNAVFLRNGKEHSAKDAEQHLRRKLKMAKKRFWIFSSNITFTAPEFIEKIASKSSFSGQKYQMRLPDGKIIETEFWLKSALSQYEIDNSPKK